MSDQDDFERCPICDKIDPGQFTSWGWLLGELHEIGELCECDHDAEYGDG